jgi:DNA-binding CsgD family transcriptional regulator
VLTLLLGGATHGRGSVALVAGEPGIGKTRLLEELAAAAGESGAQLLWGRCYEGDGAPALWPWVQILRAFITGREPATMRHQLGERAPEIAALVPELATILPDLPTRASVTAAQERFRLFDAVAATLKVAADAAPLLLLIDDLHWADSSSLLLLDFLAQDLAGAQILVAGAYRDTALRRGAPLLGTLGGLSRHPRVARIALGGLSVEDVSRCIEAATGAAVPPALATAVAADTNGNPLYVMHMARLAAADRGGAGLPAVIASMPSTLREVIDRQLERLSAGCAAALEVAAVIGREFRLPVVAAAGSLDRDAVFDALEEAETAGIIEQAATTPGHFRFTHAVIREALYEELPAACGARRHWGGSGAGGAPSAARSVAQIVELAAHYRLAVPVTSPDKAAAYARQAGDASAAVFAWEDAIGHWRTAIELADASDPSSRCDLLLAIGEAQNHLGEREQARETFLLTAEAARSLRRGDKVSNAAYLARVALGFGGPGVVLGKLDERQVGLLQEALAALGGLGQAGGTDAPNRPDLRARLLARLAMALFWTPRRGESVALSEQAVAAARHSDEPRALIAALHVRRYVLWSPEHLEERAGFASEMVEQAEALGDAELTLQGLRWRIVDSWEQGDIAAVDAATARYEQLALEIRHPYYRWYASLFRATRACATGQFAEGERLAAEALAFGKRSGDPDAEMFLTMQLLPVRAQQGRIAEQAQTLRSLAERYPTMLAYRSRIPILCADLSQVPEAREAFEAFARDTVDAEAGDFARVPRDGNWLVTMVNITRACLVLGDRGRAAALYALLEPFAGRNVVTGAAIASIGPTNHWLGELAALLGRQHEAAAHFQAALAMAESMGAVPQVAVTQHAYARLLRTGATGVTAAEQRAAALRAQALATARELGMVLLEQEILRDPVARAATEAGPAQRVPGDRFPDGLSAREVEVLRLVTAGHSNREIASELMLSILTVQNHIASVYRKTGIRNRAEAATYTLQHGLNLSPSP